jgi:hypothetical protein
LLSSAPHCAQNFADGLFGCRQSGQFIGRLRRLRSTPPDILRFDLRGLPLLVDSTVGDTGRMVFSS